MSKKLIIAIIALTMVFSCLVGATVAYLFVKTTPVTNTFSPSNIDLTLTETERTYQMVPGVVLAKDPKVTVTSDIVSYVFVKIEESDNFDTYMTYAIADGWELLNTTTGEATEIAAGTDLDGTYFLFREVAAGGGEFGILANNEVTVLRTVTKADMEPLYDDNDNVDEANQPKLTFTAYAIQKAGFEDDLAQAWNEAQGQPSNP